jgi:hypothetical protein
MNTYTAVIASMLGIAGGGWGAHEYLYSNFAPREAVLVAGGKADYLIQVQEESLVRQIAELERRPKITATERDHLNGLRKQLEEIRRVRRGK